MERTRVIDALHAVPCYTKRSLRIDLHPEMPAGPMNRVTDNARAKKPLTHGYCPDVPWRPGRGVMVSAFDRGGVWLRTPVYLLELFSQLG